MKSIGDFAENLILGELQDIHEGKAMPPSQSSNSSPGLAPAGRDIRETKVPDSFMAEVLGEEYVSSPSHEVEDPPFVEIAEEPTTELLTEATAQELIPLLMDVKNLLTEMMTGTGTGSLGATFGGSQAPPKRKKRRTTRREVLRNSIREKLTRYS